MKIRNELYLQCLDYKDTSRKEYRQNYDAICDLLGDLNSLSIEIYIGVLQDHVYLYWTFFLYIISVRHIKDPANYGNGP